MKYTFTFALALILMCLCSVCNLHAQFSGGGTGTASDPFKIKTADDLNNVRNYIGSSNAGKHFRLMNNIDLTTFLQSSTEGWLPIGDDNNPFSGYFHGGGYKVNELWINRSIDYVGFFGASSGAIDSLTVTVSTKNISGGNYTGGFVGNNSGTVTSCSVEGGNLITVSGNGYVGGFSGNNTNKLSYCYATVSSSSSDCSGGFVGGNYGTINNCYATGNSSNSSNSSSKSGGFIGYSKGTIINCYAMGNSLSSLIVTSPSTSYSSSGGLIGVNDIGGSVSNCYAMGNSSSSVTTICSFYYAYVSNYYSYSYSGSLIGNNSGTVNNCYAMGNSLSSANNPTTISSSILYIYSFSYSGGLIGINSSSRVNNCNAMGNSSSSATHTTVSQSQSHFYSYSYSGGFVGYLNAGIISNCYSAGQVTGNNYNGAFAGNCEDASSLSQCYYNLDVTGSMSSVGNNVGNNNVSGVTTTGMKIKATFINWDFDTVWVIEEGITYPYLYNMPDYVDGQVFVCANSTQTYSTYSGKSNYVWTVTNGSIVSGQSTNTVTVKWNNNTNPAKITVTYNSTEKAAKDITLISLPKPAISGELKPYTGSTAYYTTEYGMFDYAWTVTGGEITYGQGTAQISVKWDCSVSAGDVKVSYANQNGCSADVPTDITVNKQANPAPTISGELKPYAGNTTAYTTEYGMTDYTWTVTGGEIISGQGNYIVSVKWDCSVSAGHVKVNYTNQNGCSAANPTDITVNKQANPAPTISGELQPYAGSTIYYSTEYGMSDYTWTVMGGDIVSGQGTAQAGVKWDCSAAVNASIKVNYTSQGGCAIAMPSASAVSLQSNPQSTATITGELKPYIGSTTYYTTEYGMSNYTWTVTGGEIVSGQNTQQVSVLWKSTSGKLTIQYNNQYICLVQSELAVTPVQLFGAGAGTTDNPFIIKTAEQLDNVRIMPDAIYSLANDIDLTDYLKNAATGWNPIPDFSGSLDGRFFKIKGLWINLPNSDNLGLFASNNGTIENLYIEIDSQGIYGNNYVGGLAANNYGTILQCSVKKGNLTSKGTNTGGLVGLNQGTVSMCYSSNTVVWGTQGVGGLIGSATGVNAKIQQCYAVNTVVGSQQVGGLIGSMYNATCNQSYSASIVDGGNYTGGLLGYNSNGIIAGCYYDAYNSGQAAGLGNVDDPQANNIRAKQPSEMLSRSTFLGWDFNNVWINTDGETYPYFRWQDIVPTPPSAIGRIQSNQQLLTVYPNPTNGMVYIKCIPQSLVGIYNSIGKLVHQFITQQEETSVDMSTYPAGIYIFRNESQTIKVIKK